MVVEELAARAKQTPAHAITDTTHYH